MRNLLRVQLKRMLFRIETIAITLLNLFLGLVGIFLVQTLMTQIDRSKYAFSVIYLVSLLCTGAVVIVIENSNLGCGVIRNMLIAGYTKTQIYTSKYISLCAFDIVQGLLVMLPILVLPASSYLIISDHFTAECIVSMLLAHMTFSLLVSVFCLLGNGRITSVLLSVGVLIALTACSIATSVRLDETPYTYNYNNNYETNTRENVQIPNGLYVRQEDRLLAESFVLLSPMQSIDDFLFWYIPYEPPKIEGYRDYNRNWKYQRETDDRETVYLGHINRLPRFWRFQLAMLLILAIGSVLIMRKCDVK